ncbi:MAG: response regulator [Panacagrimonas sp.]|jgi:EAL domain-containing protein (putative c-di-GMP-specific phosphodiesterase class I)/CheY-like chemotaxis protein|nr:EAL domain-containing response regulator [Panacagrimonas sp.]MCC2656922.1 response regulator [Panacagrimonas sp.]
MDDPATRPRLLVLDDIEAVASTIATFARGVGFESRFVTQPTEFFEVLGSWVPEVIVLDLVMPTMDGVEVIGRLAQAGCTSRLVIASGVGSRVLDAARRAASEHGLQIVGVLSKPFQAEAARALLRAAKEVSPSARHERDARVFAPIAESDLMAGMQRGEFRLVYQPKVETRTGRLRGFEALLRWQHPQRGSIAPDRFIPVAEHTGLIRSLTDLVLEMGLDWLGRTFGESEVELSINVSGAHLDGADFAHRAVALCRAHRLPPSRITIELTETAAMQDAVASLALFTQLRTQGFALSVDDFGTGYSSMVQLVRLPFSEMKIDRSFVMTALQNPESRIVVECISHLAHGLGLSIVAEGVEDRAAARFLAELGCDLLQGYAISRPLETDQVLPWVQGWQQRLENGTWP